MDSDMGEDNYMNTDDQEAPRRSEAAKTLKNTQACM